MSKILLAGGTGFIGALLKEHLLKEGHEVYILTRSPEAHDPYQVKWDPVNMDIDLNFPEDIEVIVNLAGAPVLPKRWTRARKKVLRNSRIASTDFLVELSKSKLPELKHFISASAMGYYGDKGDEVLREEHEPGQGFLAKLCKDWEHAAHRLHKEADVSIARIGLYLHPKGGVLKLLLTLNRFFLLNSLGNGRHWQAYTHSELFNQWVSGIISGAIPAGVYNATGKESVRYKDLVHSIAKIHGRRIVLPPVPVFLIRWIFGEASSSILESHRLSGEKIARYLPQDELEEILKG